MLFWVKSISYWALAKQGIGHWALGIGHWALVQDLGIKTQETGFLAVYARIHEIFSQKTPVVERSRNPDHPCVIPNLIKHAQPQSFSYLF